MKHPRAWSVAPVIALMLLLCGHPVWGREVEITVLHTTDVHGHLFTITDYDGHEHVGGLLRCATLIEQLRAENENTLLVDCGDTIQGSAESFLTGGHLATRALEWLRYDAWVIGNHEFDWGLPALQKVHDQTRLTMLAANLRVGAGSDNALHKVQPYVIKEVDGVRIALIGLTTPGIPNWTRPDYLGNMRFESSVDALGRVMPRVRAESPDITILLVHQGYRPYGDDHANEINAITERYSELDAVIGGHTHAVQRSLRVHGVLYTQAGYHGNWLGRLDLVYDTVERALVRKDADVITIGQDYAAHEGLQRHLAEDLEAARAYLDEVVGEAAEEIAASYRMPAQSPVQQLLCKSIASRVDVDVVLHGLLDDYSLPAGPLTRADVWRIVPYENRIGIASLTAQELREVLVENLAHMNGFRFMGVDGIRYDIDLEAPRGEQVQNLRMEDGRKPHPRRRLRVAMNSYVLASGGLRFSRTREIVDRPMSRLEMTSVDTRTAVERYIRRNSPLRAVEGDQVTLIRSGRVSVQ